MKNYSENNRILWIDILRIISAFAVIILHIAAKGSFEQFGARTFEWQICNFYNSISRFCVPVFVMVSGVFLLNPERNYSIKILFQKKILRIIISFLFWSIFYTIVEIIKTHNLETIQWKTLLFGIIKGHFHMWFMYMIIGLYIITPLIRMINKDEKMTVYYLVLSFIFVFIYNPLNFFPPIKELLAISVSQLGLSVISGFSGYFILGYYLSRHKLSYSTRKCIYIIGVLAIIGTIGINGCLGYYYNNHHIVLMYNYLYPNILFMSIFVFVYFQYNFQSVHFSENIEKIVSYIGKLSFGIYLVHAFYFENIHIIGINHFFCNPIFSIPIVSILIFLLSLITVYIINKIPYINKYII